MAKGKGGGSGAVLGYLKYILGLDSLAFQEGLGDADKRMKAAQRSIAKTAEGFKDIGKTLTTYVSLPIAGAAGAILKMGGDFESSLNKLAISTQASGEQMSEMSALALKLGKDTVFGATDAADAMDELAKNGLSAQQVLDGAATAAVNLASATGSELTSAAIAISDVMQQFKIGAKDLPAAVNQIAGAVNQSKLDFADFADAIGQAGGVAGGLGVNFEDFNAAIAATSSLFSSGADAGTSFKTFLLSLAGNSKTAKEAIAEYGLQFFDATGRMRSMAAISEELRTKLGGLSDEAKSGVLKDIFGNDAMRTAIGLMDQGAKGIDTIKVKIAETDAAAQSAQRLKGFNGQVEQLTGAIETLAITIAQSGILEFVTSVVTGLGNFVDTLSEVSPETLKWATIIAAAAATLGPLALGIGAIVSGFGTMLPLLGAVAAALSGTVIPVIGVLARALIALTIAGGPISLIVTGVAAAIAIWQNWDTIGPIVKRLYEIVKTYLLDKLGAVWSWLQTKLKDVGQWFYELYDAVVGHSYVPDMVDGIAFHFGRLQAAMVDPTVKATTTAGEAFRALASDALAVLDRLFPLQKQLRDLAADRTTLDKAFAKGLISSSDYDAAERRLNAERRAAMGAGSMDELRKTMGGLSSALPAGMEEARDAALKAVADRFRETAKAAREAGASTVQMATDSLNALSNLATSIKSGGVLNILTDVFNLFGQLAKGGILGSKLEAGFAGFTGLAGFRANGGPVSAGRNYIVGERGPEMFTPSRSGYITPNGANDNGRRTRVDIVPSPYFTAVVDGRAQAVAAPIGMRAASAGANQAQADIARRTKNRFPGR